MTFLLASSVWVFHDVLFGHYRFLGHSDRWNAYLNYAQYFAENLANHSFATWTDRVFGGFDVIAQASGTPSALFLLPLFSPNNDVVGVFGYVAVGTLALTLVIAYWVIQRLWTSDRLAATAGACVYTCTTFSLVKQVDGATTLVPLVPLLFYLVHEADWRRPVRTVGPLAVLLAIAVWFGFIQELSYVLLFLGVYAAYLWLRGNRQPMLALLAAGPMALAVAVPRLIALAGQIATTGRVDVPAAETVFLEFPWILHNFDRNIFGSGGAAGFAGGYGFNPYDIDPLFASEFASLLVLAAMVTALAGLLRGRALWPGPGGAGWLLVGYVAVVELVVHNKAAYRLVQLLYANFPFEHTRIAFSAVLPVALTCAAALVRPGKGSWSWRVGAGIVVAVGMGAAATFYGFHGWRSPVLGLFHQADSDLLLCSICPVAGGKLGVATDEAIRLTVLGAVFAAIMLAGRYVPAFGSYGARTSLALVIILQSLWGGWLFISGPQTKSFSMPWEHFELVMARPDQFLPPSREEVDTLRARLDDDRYRSIVICPEDLIVPDCGNGVAFNWHIRLAEGYSNGVPRNYLDVMGGGLHGMRFGTIQGVPWKMLSLLNVRNAIVLTPAFFMNQQFDPARDLQIVPNPSPYVYPRAYFARETRSVTEHEAAAALRAEFGGLRPPDELLTAPRPYDFVEGPALYGDLDSSGEIAWSGSGDQVRFTFPPSARPRFLVVNERYTPAWKAALDGRETAMYQTNVFMRGIPLPPGASSVTLTYQSFVHFAWRYWLALTVLVGAGVGFGVRRSRNRQPDSSLRSGG